jgi:hypothetical protein
MDARVVIDESYEDEARELLDSVDWDHAKAMRVLMDMEDRDYSALSKLNMNVDELVRLGREPVRIRVNRPYERCERYFGAHRVIEEGDEDCVVLVVAEWAQWTIDRLASGLIVGRREEEA